MGKAADAETLGAHVSKEIVRVIQARGKVLSLPKSKFAALILEKWFRDGCPAVTEPDQKMRSQVMDDLQNESMHEALESLKKKDLEAINRTAYRIEHGITVLQLLTEDQIEKLPKPYRAALHKYSGGNGNKVWEQIHQKNATYNEGAAKENAGEIARATATGAKVG